MSWSLGGTKIFVQKIPGGVKQIIAKLQPLSGGTVYQRFGYETNSVKLSAITVGTANRNALRAFTTTGIHYHLLDPDGTDVGAFYVLSVSDDRVNCISQSIDLTGTLDCDSPVFNLEIELFEVV